MIIDGDDLTKLKKYLLKSLVSISDADNEALSEYIIALLRNDKPIGQLKKECLEQLEEFLEAHNKEFVRKLFLWLGRLPGFMIDQAFEDPSSQNTKEPEVQENEAKRIKMEHETLAINESNPKTSKAPSQTFPIESLSTSRSSSRTYNSHSTQFPRQGLQRCRDYEELGYCTKAENCPYPHGADAIRMQGEDLFSKRLESSKQSANGKAAMSQDDYDPSEPYVMHHRGGARPPYNSRGNRGGFQRGRMGGENYHTSSRFYNAPRENFSLSRDTLLLENVPSDKLNEEFIKEYFERFGEVEQIVLDKFQPNADVQFKTNDGAYKAISSADPIFDNRFVKLSWKRIPFLNTPKSATSFTPESRPPYSFFKPDAESEKARKQAILNKRTELFAKQLEEQKKLLALVESKSLPEEDRKSILSSLKVITESISQNLESIKKEKAQQAVQAEALKAQSDNNMETDAPVKPSPFTKPAHNGGFGSNRWVRGEAAPQSFSLDNRPKAFKLFGFATEKRDVVEVHLKSLKGVDSTKLVDDNASFIVECKSHYLAKRAQSDVLKLDGMTFETSWISQHSLEPATQTTASVSNE